MNVGAKTGVNKSPAKKSKTMGKSDKKRRESIFTTNSSKMSSKLTDKYNGSVT